MCTLLRAELSADVLAVTATLYDQVAANAQISGSIVRESCLCAVLAHFGWVYLRMTSNTSLL
jgi:hypothetical protein